MATVAVKYEPTTNSPAPFQIDPAMKNELVSIVIPSYNRGHSIERTIDSALAQTHQALDIIIVDDGSTDDTAERVRRYQNDPRVRYIHQQNRGVAAARNVGLAAARGDYIALLDSDDIWFPWKLEVQLACLRALPKEVGMIWTDMEAIGPNGELVNPRYLRTMYSAYRWFPGDSIFSNSRPLNEVCPESTEFTPGAQLYWGDIFSPMVMGNLVHTPTTLMRRERLERVKGFNDSVYKICGEDYDYHLRTCREGPVAFINISTIKYQVGLPGQLTHRSFAIHMARGFLTTVTDTLEKDRERITLPNKMISEVQAHAHRWLAVEHIELGQHPPAREHMLQSLRYRPWQPKVWAVFIITLLPPTWSRAVFLQLRAIKRRLLAMLGRQSAAS